MDILDALTYRLLIGILAVGLALCWLPLCLLAELLNRRCTWSMGVGWSIMCLLAAWLVHDGVTGAMRPKKGMDP